MSWSQSRQQRPPWWFFFPFLGAQRADCAHIKPSVTPTPGCTGATLKAPSLKAARRLLLAGGRGGGRKISPTCGSHTLPTPKLLFPPPHQFSHLIPEKSDFCTLRWGQWQQQRRGHLTWEINFTWFSHIRMLGKQCPEKALHFAFKNVLGDRMNFLQNASVLFWGATHYELHCQTVYSWSGWRKAFNTLSSMQSSRCWLFPERITVCLFSCHKMIMTKWIILIF